MLFRSALCDGDQALVEDDLRELGGSIRALAGLMGRELSPAPAMAAAC